MKRINGIKIHVIAEKKFKDIGVSIRFSAPLREESASARSMLAMLFCDYCAAYPSKQAMANHMDRLYGMSFHASTMGYGKGQVLEIRSRILDDRYVDSKEHLLEEQFAFLHEVIFHPYLEDGKFAESMIEEARTVLLSKLKRMQDDPSSYSVSRALELADHAAPLSISALGTKKRIQSISGEEVFAAYEQLLQEDEIDVIVCGNVDERKIEELVKRYLPFSGEHREIAHAYQVQIAAPLRRIEESKAISQTYLMLLYQSNCQIGDKNYWPLKVANAMLGQYPSSFLFQEVREKHSLCYSIYSNLISFDGALAITTGIQRKDIEKAIALIHEQVEKIKSGAFSEELFATSKDLLYASIKGTKDEMASFMAYAYQCALLKEPFDLESTLQEIKAVTREDIIQAASLLEEKLIYVLYGEEEADA